jgi:hypothetical protein
LFPKKAGSNERLSTANQTEADIYLSASFFASSPAIAALRLTGSDLRVRATELRLSESSLRLMGNLTGLKSSLQALKLFLQQGNLSLPSALADGMCSAQIPGFSQTVRLKPRLLLNLNRQLKLTAIILIVSP